MFIRRVRWDLLKTGVGLKALMAASGVLLTFWVFLHMLGNLLVFAGPDVINTYGATLQSHPLVWVMRAGLVLLAVIHVACAWLTTARSKRARAERYRRPLRGSESTISSRSMRWGGLFVLLFLVYHVLHIFGPLHASYVAGDVYHNVVAGMSDPLAGAVYVAATIVFGLHLHHGAQSSIRSLGYEGVLSPTVRRVGIVATVVITIGFLAPVAAAMSGMLAA